MREEQEELGWRMVLYRLLSRGFSYPTPSLAEELIQGTYQEGLREGLAALLFNTRYCPLPAAGRPGSVLLSPREANRILSGINLLECSCRRADPAVLTEELEVEYTRLFINGYPRMVAPPYASVYLDRESGVGGPAAAWVRRMYRKAGVDTVAGFPEQPDHIMVELEFMLYLLQGGLDWKERAALEREFISHLWRWAPRFLRLAQQGTRHLFYQTVAEVTAVFLESEALSILKRQDNVAAV